MTNRTITLCLAALFMASTASAQKINIGKNYEVTLTGSVQSDILVPQNDDAIGTDPVDDKVLTNTYVELHALSKYVDAGARFEYLDHPLPGYEKDFKGYGVPFYYIKGKLKNAELTLGNYYEQFGSGFILRTYEDRALGVDNSLLGARIVYRPYKGIQLKALAGTQRCYWDYNSLISGADAEFSLTEWFPSMQQSNTYITLGASWVNKHEHQKDQVFADVTHMLNIPENVNSFDVRANLQKSGFNILAEYAQKTQDPSADNGYIYRRGYVTMLSGSYSKSGMSVLLQAKRSDNMASRSRRSMTGMSSFVNHMPAFTMEHTYALAALYPYATQYAKGEWAYQGEIGYRFKRHTALGGKYGTGVKLNFSHVHAIDRSESGTLIVNDANGTTTTLPAGSKGTNGYGSSFWKWGDATYYQDINVQIEKKMSKSMKLNLMYMNQFYNKTALQGEGGMIHSDIFVADAKYRFNNSLTLRGEVQYLNTKDDQGDWLYGLLELSVLPGWMFTVSDMYNNGSTKLHYYQGSVTYTHEAHRLQLGYGRTRAGFNCSGGVCRYVPASKGVTLSYNYNF